MQKKVLLVIGIIILATAAIGGAWYFLTKDNSNTNQPVAADTQPEGNQQTQPATEQLPAVIATVNGEEISSKRLLQAESQIMANQSIDPTTMNEETFRQVRIQALDNLIGNTLVKQAATLEGTDVEDAQVEAEFNNFKNQFTEEGAFETLLQQQNMTEEEFKALIKTDLVLKKYLEQKLGLLDMTATDEEVNAFYTEQASSTVEGLPPLEEVADQIKTLIIQQKQSQAVMNYLIELKNNGQIEILI